MEDQAILYKLFAVKLASRLEEQSNSKQSKAIQSKAIQSKAMQSNPRQSSENELTKQEVQADIELRLKWVARERRRRGNGHQERSQEESRE